MFMLDLREAWIIPFTSYRLWVEWVPSLMENLMFTCYSSPNLDVILYGSVNHIIDSCFGPVSLLWLAVWSRPTASQTVSFCLSKWVYGISVTAQCGTCETFSKNSQHLLGCELYASLCVLLGLSGTVMFINPPTTQEIFCALESAHLVSIQGIKSWRGWDAAQSCGKAGLSLHVHLLHYTSPSYIH